VGKAAVGALAYVTPMALLGSVALVAFRRLDGERVSRARLVATHATLGLAFGVAVTGSNWLLFSLLHRLLPAAFDAPTFRVEYKAWEALMGLLIYGVLAGVCHTILLQRRVREEEARATRATALKTEAELRALRARLEPHFLFNTLHSLLALVRHDPGRAEEALEQFGDLLRYTLDTQKDGEVVPLGEEIAFVRNYLSLESLRLGERLRLEMHVDPAVCDVRVPAFCLQPIVENAIRHGIAPRATGGRLRVAALREGGSVRIEVADDGAGASPDSLADAHGIGLRLVRERLALRHGAAARCDVDTAPGRGFRVTIVLPAAEDGE
jgi:LytS/YehU family sensor histidine kinase